MRALAETDTQTTLLLGESDGAVLTSLPGVAVIRAAAFAAHSLPIERYPSAEQLYSSTGLAPASYQSASVNRHGGISRQGLPEHRDALMAIAWGLSRSSPSFGRRLAELRARLRADPGAGRGRARRLPALPRPPPHARTVRRSALSSGPSARAVTAHSAMPHGVT